MAGRTVMEKDLLEETYQATMNRGDADRAESEGFLQPDIQVSYTQGEYAMGWIRGYYRGK